MTTNHIEALAGLTITGAAIVGGTVADVITRIIADVSGSPLPEWLTVLASPLGMVAALVYGLKWMTGKLDASEKRADAREIERNAKLEQVERRADERENLYKTHIERLHEKHTEKLEALSFASVKVTDKVANSMDALVRELAGRPCGIGMVNDRQELSE